MFGSLVVVFPTPHEGGTLVLRHGGKEWTFDSATAMAAHDTPHIAYIAFYSDVEHEVTLVKSGYRVTATYNLYFAPPTVGVPAMVPATSNSVVEAAMTAELQRLLADPSFLPDGGHLMFCLRHQYPVDTEDNHKGSVEKLQALSAYLKGSDAVVHKVCAALGLATTVMLVFRGYKKYAYEDAAYLRDRRAREGIKEEEDVEEDEREVARATV